MTTKRIIETVMFSALIGSKLGDILVWNWAFGLTLTAIAVYWCVLNYQERVVREENRV